MLGKKKNQMGNVWDSVYMCDFKFAFESVSLHVVRVCLAACQSVYLSVCTVLCEGR